MKEISLRSISYQHPASSIQPNIELVAGGWQLATSGIGTEGAA
jgi:hypothetical protein